VTAEGRIRGPGIELLPGSSVRTLHGGREDDLRRVHRVPAAPEVAVERRVVAESIRMVLPTCPYQA